MEFRKPQVGYPSRSWIGAYKTDSDCRSPAEHLLACTIAWSTADSFLSCVGLVQRRKSACTDVGAGKRGFGTVVERGFAEDQRSRIQRRADLGGVECRGATGGGISSGESGFVAAPGERSWIKGDCTSVCGFRTRVGRNKISGRAVCRAGRAVDSVAGGAGIVF